MSSTRYIQYKKTRRISGNELAERLARFSYMGIFETNICILS